MKLTPQEIREFSVHKVFSEYSGEISFDSNIDESLCNMVQLSTGKFVKYHVSESGKRIIKSVSELLCG